MNKGVEGSVRIWLLPAFELAGVEQPFDIMPKLHARAREGTRRVNDMEKLFYRAQSVRRLQDALCVKPYEKECVFG